jgi:hypothetical protein
MATDSQSLTGFFMDISPTSLPRSARRSLYGLRITPILLAYQREGKNGICPVRKAVYAHRGREFSSTIRRVYLWLPWTRRRIAMV